MLGQRMRTGKSLRFVVEKWEYIDFVSDFPFKHDIWCRVRGFPRLSQAETYKATRGKQHPGETLRIRDLREGGNG